MSSIIIHPSMVLGSIKAPASKSVMQRACAAALLKGGVTHIENYGISNDDEAALNIIECLGATITRHKKTITVMANDFYTSAKPNNINCGESGLSVRMFMPIIALLSEEFLIIGEGSLLNRPMKTFVDIFPKLNVTISTTDNHLPIKINGSLKPADIEVDGSISSQFLTGLLLAYSKYFLEHKFNIQQPAVIKVKNLNSKPYIDLTLQIMADFGLPVPTNNNYGEFVFMPNNYTNTSKELWYNIEGDWSNAAFLLVAAAINGRLSLQGLNLNSHQADKQILDVLRNIGCEVEFAKGIIQINNNNSGNYFSFVFDATHSPDLFPPLVVLAANCNGTSTIKGVKRLMHKESNRAVALHTEFAKMGVDIFIKDDEMFVKGTKQINAATVHSHNDHRIAMTCAIAALNVAGGVITIEGADAIKKSYPNFFEDLKSITSAC